MLATVPPRLKRAADRATVSGVGNVFLFAAERVECLLRRASCVRVGFVDEP